MKKIVYSLLFLGAFASSSSATCLESIKGCPAKACSYAAEHHYVGGIALGGTALIVYDLTRGEKSLIIKGLKKTGALTNEAAQRLGTIAKKYPYTVLAAITGLGLSSFVLYQHCVEDSFFNRRKVEFERAEAKKAKKREASEAREVAKAAKDARDARAAKDARDARAAKDARDARAARAAEQQQHPRRSARIAERRAGVVDSMMGHERKAKKKARQNIRETIIGFKL